MGASFNKENWLTVTNSLGVCILLYKQKTGIQGGIMDKKTNCVSCNKPNHPERVEMGLKQCVNCVSTAKYGVVPNWGHKTGGDVIIVHNQESAAKINKAFDRRNYGIVKGMKGSTGN